MVEKDLVIKEKVESSGLLDFKGFYSYAHSWFKDEGFGVTEEKYSEKFSGNSKDIDIEWRAIKELSEYFKVEIFSKWEIKDLVDVEVEIDGKTKKMNKGKILLEIKGSVIRDPESKWDASPLLRFSRDFYNKYIIPNRVNDIKEKVILDIKKLKEELKAFLDLTGKRE